MLIDNITQAVGNTPILKAERFSKSLCLGYDIYAKLEYMNPAGSIKDRAALFMVKDAMNKGLLKKGGTVVEPTSGNTGIGLAMASSSLNYSLILTMPENMSEERIKILKAYGAKVVLTEKEKGMAGAIDKAKEIVRENKNAFLCGQFENKANTLAHFESTGPEIYKDIGGKIGYFVSCVGTGGTLSGAGGFLKSKNPDIKVIAVEPETSAVLSGKDSGAHKIQGIGAGFVPAILEKDIIDKIVTVSNEDAFKYSKIFAKTEGVLVGISSGAALCATVKLSKLYNIKDKGVAVILPDSGDRYYSTELFDD